MTDTTTHDEDQARLRCHALTYAVEAWRDYRNFPGKGQADDRTRRIVQTAEAFAAFLTPGQAP